MQPGEFSLGVCWYPEQWPEPRWPRDAARMRELGITTVRLGEFAWSRLQPARGEWNADWLRRALDILHAHDLSAILGTPSATPPRWLLDDFPDMLRVDAAGRESAFGSRRFACLAHAGYARASLTVARRLAREFGEHPAVVAWQIDNEYACHDTAQSWSARAARLFRRWLRARYGGDIDALNRAWGNAFWSMEYAAFAQIDPPRPTPAGNNPAHILDFQRFWSERTVTFNRRQVAAVRRHSPARDVFHDCMGFSTDFDHFALAADLDCVAWNSYPLGFLARHGGGDGDLHRHPRSPRLKDCGGDESGGGDGETSGEVAGDGAGVGDSAGDHRDPRQKHLRLGDPDHAAFHHDLYRAVGRGRFSITEQQPGAVNWAAYNPQPAAGAVRFWTWQAFAHGAEMVAYFRWRQFARAQEAFHAGLLRPDDQPAPGAAEVAQVAAELSRLPACAFAPPSPAAVALVFDYASCWMRDSRPHGDAPALTVYLAFYAALRRAGVDVDIVSPGADFSGRKLVVAPLLLAPPEDFAERLRRAGCAVVFGARAGSFTVDGGLHESPPGPLRELLGLTVQCVESLPPTVKLPVVWRDGDVGDGDPPHRHPRSPRLKHCGGDESGGGDRDGDGGANRWREFVDPAGAKIIAEFDGDGDGHGDGDGGNDGDGDGHGGIPPRHPRSHPPRHPRSLLSGGGAVFRHGDAFYLAARPDACLLDAVVARALAHAGITAAAPPADVRVRRRGDLQWFFNYGDAPADLGAHGEIVLGDNPIPPGGVLALRRVP